MIWSNFKTKLLLVTVVPVIITSIILAYILISGRVDEFNKRINNQGNNIVNYLSLMSEYGIFTNNFGYLEPILAHTLNQKNIVAVYIEDSNKKIVLKRFNKRYKKINLRSINENFNKSFSSSIRKTSVVIDDMDDAVYVTPSNNSTIGTVNIIMNLSDVKLLKTKIVRDGIVTTFILTLITVIVALLFARSVTKPISRIYEGVNTIKQGGLEHRIPVNFSGELAELANGINEMTSELEIAQLSEKQRNQALLNAKQEAERANRAKSLFLSSMSHEMRTPMNAILGFSQLIEMDAEDECTKDNVGEVIKASHHLLELIEDLLSISEIESNKINICIENYELKNILDFCISMVKSSADEMSIQIDNKVDLLPDIKVHVDDKRFKQVILNLLANAIKYNHKKGSVIIDYSIEDNKILCLSIIDTGKGIPIDYHNQVFNYFDRAGQEASNIAGSGLGLAISRKLIEKMNGSIGFESIDGKGSHFWIKIPI